jgi:phospholipid N-methyltransferase
MNLPFSQACENNKQPILEVLREAFKHSSQVLEIGAGTGQHSVHFAAHLTHLRWQCADLAANLPIIRQWHAANPCANLLEPEEFDMQNPQWPAGFDAVFSANTAHIMPCQLTQKMLVEVAQQLPAGGIFVLYGPFNYSGTFTSESNARFDTFLKEQAAHMGIRDFEALNKLATANGMNLLKDYEMPANNRCLVWQKSREK